MRSLPTPLSIILCFVMMLRSRSTSKMPTPGVMTMACWPVLSRFLLMKCFSKVLSEMLRTSRKFPWEADDRRAGGVETPGLVW